MNIEKMNVTKNEVGHIFDKVKLLGLTALLGLNLNSHAQETYTFEDIENSKENTSLLNSFTESKGEIREVNKSFLIQGVEQSISGKYKEAVITDELSIELSKQWFILNEKNSDGAISYIDYNKDGIVDRYIKTVAEEYNRDSFLSSDLGEKFHKRNQKDLQDAVPEAMLDLEILKLQAYIGEKEHQVIIDINNNKMTAIDFIRKYSGVIDEENALEIKNNIQNQYNKKLQEAVDHVTE